MAHQTKAQASLQKLAEQIKSVKEGAQETAPEAENQVIVTGIVASLERILNRLFFLAGITHAQKFEPLPPFIINKDEVPVDHKVDKDEKAIFLEKVDKLFALITTIHPDGLLTDYSLPEDQLVIRGVAKRAGLDNFEDAELSVEFIEAIQEAIKAKEQQLREDAELDRKLLEETGQQVANTASNQEEGDDEDEDLEDHEEWPEYEEEEEVILTGNEQEAPPPPAPVERKKPGPKPKPRQ